MKKTISADKATDKDAGKTTGRGKRKSRLNLLGHFERIVELSENSGLSDEFLAAAKPHIDYVKRCLHLNDVQAIFLAHFVDQSDEYNIRLSEIAKTVKCRNVRLVKYMDDIDELEKRRYVRCSREGGISYRIPRDVLDALRKNTEYKPESKKNISVGDFFAFAEQLFDERSNSELTFNAMVYEINTLLSENPHLEIARKLIEYKLSDDDEILLLLFCSLFVYNNDDCVMYHDFEKLYDRIRFRRIVKSLTDKEHKLFDLGLIEHSGGDGFGDRERFKLTSKAKNELLGELNIVEKQVENKTGLILSSSIVAKEMFYNENEREQIDRLVSLLDEKNFKCVVERLRDRGMCTGFACLFHGAPGTGKTETVYQIARLTGRDILPVDVSQTKSMWFGESEKKIKEVFDRYKTYANSSRIAPLLLFNEADAVIGKRKDTNSSAVAQTENAIQNIILQEMENLEGIMIATTNLTRNFDRAFERRFLYKIEFNKPSLEAKRQIWKSILPSVSDDDVERLASGFDFSGGQIENVARKYTVDTIVSGHEPAFETLEDYCKHETSEQQRSKMGFRS